MRFRRHHHVVNFGGGLCRAQHWGDRVSVDISVENAHFETALCQGNCQIDGRGRFSDTTFARGDGVDGGTVARLIEEDLFLRTGALEFLPNFS